ncbi:hypothetical protein NPIL_265491 [Nephila pilipes]|uniref:Uncharacterized protein n=1 Tax=Nephila pilipes TaxID=299642 RepID=A0A8X6QJ29_NEPPI|nr:hypothetical protein NPIL_265491 [Nephila pilipes]
MMLLQSLDEIDCLYARLTRHMLLSTLCNCDVPKQISSLVVKTRYRRLLQMSVVIMKITVLFRNEFQTILHKIDDIVRDSESELEMAEIYISVCLKFCQESTYYSFMLVAAFLNSVVFKSFKDTKCFRIFYVCEFCFDVLYRRKFSVGLNCEEDHENLMSTCNELNVYLDNNLRITFLHENAFGLYCLDCFEDCTEISRECFELISGRDVRRILFA